MRAVHCRCAIVRYSKLSEQDILARLLVVCEKEKVCVCACVCVCMHACVCVMEEGGL